MEMIPGEDIRMEQILEFLGKVLLCKFLDASISGTSLNTWVKQHWSSILGYGYVFHILAKGWSGFQF